MVSVEGFQEGDGIEHRKGSKVHREQSESWPCRRVLFHKIIYLGSDQIKEHFIGCTGKFGFYPRSI